MRAWVGVTSFAILAAAAGGLRADTTGDLVLGASVSSIYGATGFASFLVEDAFDRNIDIDLNFRAGEEGRGLGLGVTSARSVDAPVLGYDAELFTRLNGEVSEWDFNNFDAVNVRWAVGVRAQITPTLSYRSEVFLDYIDIGGFDAGTSAIIQRDEGEALAGGAALSLSFSTRENEELLTPGYGVSVGLRVSEGDNRDWWLAFLSTENVVPIAGRTALRLTGSAGMTTSRNEDGFVPIYDRAFLGGNAPRGFAYGGLGPRDPLTDQALGGTQYATASVAFLAPVGQRGITLGAFADFGSVWDLPGNTDPVLGDDYSLRASAGISLHWGLDIGTLSISLSEPIEQEAFDETQAVSIDFQAVF